MTAERGCHRKPNASVSSSGFRDEARQVLGHVPPWREHERMNDDRGRALGDAASEPLGDGGLRELHVSRLHDARRAESLLDQRSDFSEQGVGRSASAPVVDQEHRGAVAHRLFVRAGEAHRAYLGHALQGVKNCGRHQISSAVRQSALDRPEVRAAKQIDVHQQRVELIEGNPFVRSRCRWMGLDVCGKHALTKATEQPHHR